MKEIAKALLQAKNKTVPILTFPSAQLLNISVKELISSAEMQAKGMEAIAKRCPVGAALECDDGTAMTVKVETEIPIGPYF